MLLRSPPRYLRVEVKSDGGREEGGSVNSVPPEGHWGEFDQSGAIEPADKAPLSLGSQDVRVTESTIRVPETNRESTRSRALSNDALRPPSLPRSHSSVKFEQGSAV